MKKSIRSVIDIAYNVIIYFIVFFVVKLLSMVLATVGFYLKRGDDVVEALQKIGEKGIVLDSTIILVGTLLSSLLTLWLFLRLRWTPFSRDYLRSRPWTAMVWVVVAAFGSLVPSIWFNEVLDLTMPDAMEDMLKGLMQEPLGYLAVGILVPLTEEAVFRGAILRTLLKGMSGPWKWGAIVISAAIFGLAHGNDAQFYHAFLIGVLIGWMYVRTGSIVPGVVYHVVNNSIAYILTTLYPHSSDMKLIDLAGGSQLKVTLWVVFSLCIFVPAIFQLTRLLKRK
ncbi:CPBP family intramembrane glutamic endopeptidase [Prevotella sp.]|uniref:CPBP family intramembrane glutamic endopeptidase n=1 Tax=Prevotella sp. TaxID=59823 RepID=UPI002F932B54